MPVPRHIGPSYPLSSRGASGRRGRWPWVFAVTLAGTLLAGSVAVPLLPAQPGRTAFELLPAAAAGIGFTNRLTPEAIVRNQNFMNGSGVALGDVDGDGRCDLYLAAIDGTNRLYLNRGSWVFGEAPTDAGVALAGAHSTGAVLEDLDGDGDLDLLVATLGGGPRCLRNEGRARFTDITAECGLAAPTGSTSLALGDVDGNGTVDLYVANHGSFPILRSGPGRAQVRQVNGRWIVEGPNSDRLRVVNAQIEEVGEPGRLYLNDGHARFRPVPWDSGAFLDEQGRPRSAPPDFGLGAVLRDVDGDGKPDLYACNDFQTPDRLWLNQGDGRFRAAPRLALRKFAFSSMGADFGDLDHDGHLDFFTVEMAPRRHERRLRSMTGVRFLPPAPGRFDYRPEVPRNTLYRGHGDGTWSEIAEFAGLTATDWSWHPLFLDADLDGWEDILVMAGAIHDVQDRDTLARIQGSGRGNSATNVLLYPAFASPISAFRNRGEFRFEEVHEAWGFTATNLFQGAALADLDGDGDLDLVCNRLNDSPALYRNTAAAPRLMVRARGVGGNPRGLNARIRVTGGPVAQTQEIVAGGRYLSGDDPARTFAAGGPGPFTVEVTWRSGRVTRLTNAAAGHLHVVDERDAVPATPVAPAQPRPLFTDESAAVGHVAREEYFDDFARQPLLHRQLSLAGPPVAWLESADPARPFLVIGPARGQSPGIFRRRADGGWENVATDWRAPDDVAAFTAWIAPDGTPALLASVGNYETAPAPASVVCLRPVATDNRMEVTPCAEVLPAAFSLGSLAAADFDADGQLDLFIGARITPGRYPESGPSRLFRGQGGRLTEPVAIAGLEAAGLVQGAVWSDLECDGFPELVLASEWGPVRIFRNHRGALEPWDPPVRLAAAAPVPLSTLTGWWSSVTSGDFDGDGRLDLVTGNWGENTGYQATPRNPLRLFFGDLAGTGGVDLVEAYRPAELPLDVPRRGLRALGLAFPQLAARFPTHAEFARASLADVLGAIPRPAQMAEARILASVAWLNRGDHWLARPLPLDAQLAPAFGVSVADVNGDGHEDLLLAQNFHTFRPEWPRPDAGRGAVLLGDGQGGFRNLPAAESGVLVHGEQRGCAVADFDQDGRCDWIDTQVGAATRVFRNVSGAPGLRVRLRGPAGNPAGYGATLQLLRDSGTGPVRELHAAAGMGSVDHPVTVLAGGGRALRVRWPGGAVTETPIPAGARELEATAPAARP